MEYAEARAQLVAEGYDDDEVEQILSRFEQNERIDAADLAGAIREFEDLRANARTRPT